MRTKNELLPVVHLDAASRNWSQKHIQVMISDPYGLEGGSPPPSPSVSSPRWPPGSHNCYFSCSYQGSERAKSSFLVPELFSHQPGRWTGLDSWMKNLHDERREAEFDLRCQKEEHFKLWHRGKRALEAPPPSAEPGWVTRWSGVLLPGWGFLTLSWLRCFRPWLSCCWVSSRRLTGERPASLWLPAASRSKDQVQIEEDASSPLVIHTRNSYWTHR